MADNNQPKIVYVFDKNKKLVRRDQLSKVQHQKINPQVITSKYDRQNTNSYQPNMTYENQIKRLKDRNNQLEKENKLLKEKIHRLETATYQNFTENHFPYKHNSHKTTCPTSYAEFTCNKTSLHQKTPSSENMNRSQNFFNPSENNIHQRAISNYYENTTYLRQSPKTAPNSPKVNYKPRMIPSFADLEKCYFQTVETPKVYSRLYLKPKATVK